MTMLDFFDLFVNENGDKIRNYPTPVWFVYTNTKHVTYVKHIDGEEYCRNVKEKEFSIEKLIYCGMILYSTYGDVPNDDYFEFGEGPEVNRYLIFRDDEEDMNYSVYHYFKESDYCDFVVFFSEFDAQDYVNENKDS